MPGGRAYDYSAPFFGGFTCAPPAVNTTRADRASAYASTRADSLRRSEFSNSRQSSFARSDSLSSQKSFARADSLSRRPQLSRMESLGRTPTTAGTVSTSSEYSIGADGRPTHYSSTTYKSPYGNNYRTSTHY
ncbi:unnamed protein product [Allacma fusca]|uniref:Uncharacterized protein n=1 Tax=Allacma fusca TaxID=39272 RepID=A0A8J2LUV7_9HEXA|nr:unnamed protein product [Allacma fusca]